MINAFGDLEHQRFRRQAMFGEDVSADHGGELRILEIDRRQIDRHAGNIESGLAPLRHLPAGLADRPQADLLDQAALFGQRDEFRRRDLAEHRIVPARQRLDAVDGAVDGSDLRLIDATSACRWRLRWRSAAL